MAKKAAKRSTAGEKSFSTREITNAISKALDDLRAERKAKSAGWSLRQRERAALCEVALRFARKNCACTSSSMSFP